MVRQYSDWLRDNWNHPSVAIWDANNESLDPIFEETIIPAVRPLDLSNRPWENSYNQPVGPDDPIEDHPYLYSGYLWGGPFTLTDLETADRLAQGAAQGGPGDDPQRVRVDLAPPRRRAHRPHRAGLRRPPRRRGHRRRSASR